jgi:hypothetical protein
MSKLRIYGSASLAALLLAAAPALAGKPVLISECGAKIYEPGKYFVTQDLNCAPGQQGIKVFSSDVTVNLKGHTITCAQGAGLVGAVLVGGSDGDDGVYVGLTNVRVKNGTVSGCNDGVIFFYTESGEISKVTATNSYTPDGSAAGGITLLEASNTVVKNNVGIDNFDAIRSFGGVNNKFKHNWSTGSRDAGLIVDAWEVGSSLVCNTSDRDLYGIAMGSGVENVVRGNLVTNAGDVGIVLYGLAWGEFIWDEPFDNVVQKNLVQTSGRADLAEVLFDLVNYDLIVSDDAQCLNTWTKNQYSTWMGPENCVAPTVELDDVCALDDDD